MAEIIVFQEAHKSMNGDINKYTYSYTWEGSKFGTALITIRQFDLSLYTLNLVPIDTVDFDRCYLVVRGDVLFGLWAKGYRFCYKAKWKFMKKFGKLLYKAAEKGWIYWPEGTVFSFRYCLKRNKK